MIKTSYYVGQTEPIECGNFDNTFTNLMNIYDNILQYIYEEKISNFS